jgi:hypothetical protein
MLTDLAAVKPGLALVLAGLLFGIGLGISFGVDEDSYEDYITAGIAANPELHDEKSSEKIWRYAQRAHFHATGIGAFSIGLVLLVTLSGMQKKHKTVSSLLIGLGACYPLSWYVMYLQAPGMGRDAAHHHLLTEIFTYVGVGGLLAGMFILLGSLFLGLFNDG